MDKQNFVVNTIVQVLDDIRHGRQEQALTNLQDVLVVVCAETKIDLVEDIKPLQVSHETKQSIWEIFE